MSYQLSAPYLNMSLGCYDMYCTCSGECPLALHAGPALMFYGDPLGSALSGHVFMFPSLMPCGNFIGWKRRESLDCYHPFPRWEWIPIMFHRLQRRPGVQFYQLRRNTSSPNLQLTSQDRFHFSYQRSEGDLRGERRLGALVLIPDRANIWHLSRFNHGIFWMIQPGVHICVFAEFIVYSLNTYGRLMTNSKT